MTTLWRLASTAGAAPIAIERITGQNVSLFAVGLDSASHTARLIAAADVYNGPTKIVCQHNSCPPSPPIPQSHLIWQPTP